MSWLVAKACAERKFGSASRKQIIMFLADKASDDGSGIWCSKGTIQRHTELSKATVKRTVRELKKEGLLIETGERSCQNGFTVVYQIDLAMVAALAPVKEDHDTTGVTVNPVQSDPGTGVTVHRVPGSQRPPNHPKKIQKPCAREAGAQAADIPDRPAPHIRLCIPRGSVSETMWNEWLKRHGYHHTLAEIGEPVGDGFDALWSKPPSANDETPTMLAKKWADRLAVLHQSRKPQEAA